MDHNPEHVLNITGGIVSTAIAAVPDLARDLPSLISAVYAAVASTAQPSEAKLATGPAPVPAVPIRSSIKPSYIVCLEDGAKLKMLKRYLRTQFGMTPEDYRAKWGLSRDYPMVAPDYAEKRRELAIQHGLGRKPKVKVSPARKKAA